jgi:phenylacetate-CoA ligase
MLIIRGVNVFPSQIEELLLRSAGLTPHYLLELTRQGHLDALAVHVECTAEICSALDTRQRLCVELANLIKTNIGVSVVVHVRDPGALERSAGKARRVLDLRPKSS